MSLPPFQRILDAHAPHVQRFLVAAVGRDDADDCFQETFLSALRAYPRLRHRTNLRAWVLTIAHRKAIDSHLGPLLGAVTPTGLVRLAYSDERHDAVLDDLAARLSPRVLEAPARLAGVRRDLDEYFAGHRRGFRIPIDWSLTSGFGRRVL